jgi:hypothetical protein
LSAGRGITGVEKGREQAAYWVANADRRREGRAGKRGKRADIIKIWVDDRDNTVPKLTPEIYGAIIDEAHKANIRVTRAHLRPRRRGRVCCNANVDAFAHSVRDATSTTSSWPCMKAKPNLVVNPNLPAAA